MATGSGRVTTKRSSGDLPDGQGVNGAGPDGVAPDGAAPSGAATDGQPPDAELRLFALPGPVTQLSAQPAGQGRGRARGGSRRGRRRPSPLLLVVDGTGLAHRVFHAVGGPEAPEEAPVERFLAVLCRLATDARATACLVGFDDPVRSLRRDADPVYKAQRPPKPSELVELLDRLPDILSELGLAVVTPPGLEADDVLGSAAAAADRHRVAATLATGDRDAFSLVRPTVSVWYLGNGGSVERVSPSWLAARYGVKPAAYLDFAALRGDTSDNLPGVRGIGAMTAARLLSAYTTVEAALADPHGVSRLLGPSLTHTLVEGRAIFMHNRDLMRIRTDVAIDLDACNQALDRATVTRLLRSAGIADLTERVLRSFSLLGQAAWRCPPPESQVADVLPVPDAEAAPVPVPDAEAEAVAVAVAEDPAGPEGSRVVEAHPAEAAAVVVLDDLTDGAAAAVEPVTLRMATVAVAGSPHGDIMPPAEAEAGQAPRRRRQRVAAIRA